MAQKSYFVPISPSKKLSTRIQHWDGTILHNQQEETSNLQHFTAVFANLDPFLPIDT